MLNNGEKYKVMTDKDGEEHVMIDGKKYSLGEQKNSISDSSKTPSSDKIASIAGFPVVKIEDGLPYVNVNGEVHPVGK